MIKKDLFNEDSICIFTDASFYKTDPNPTSNIGSVCSAYVVYYKDLLVDQGYHILHNTTTQRGELYALLLGVMIAFKYRNYKHIRIFSDSQTSVYAIRDRIFNWLRSENINKMLGKYGSIKNQDYIMNIISNILENNIPIEFYHVRGHVELYKYESLQEAKSLFQRSNNFNEYIDDALIQQIAIGNDHVDRYATYMLHTQLNNPIFDTTGLKNGLIDCYCVPFNTEKYKTLVNPRGVK